MTALPEAVVSLVRNIRREALRFVNDKIDENWAASGYYPFPVTESSEIASSLMWWFTPLASIGNAASIITPSLERMRWPTERQRSMLQSAFDSSEFHAVLRTAHDLFDYVVVADSGMCEHIADLGIFLALHDEYQMSNHGALEIDNFIYPSELIRLIARCVFDLKLKDSRNDALHSIHTLLNRGIEPFGLLRWRDRRAAHAALAKAQPVMDMLVRFEQDCGKFVRRFIPHWLPGTVRDVTVVPVERCKLGRVVRSSKRKVQLKFAEDPDDIDTLVLKTVTNMFLMVCDSEYERLEVQEVWSGERLRQMLARVQDLTRQVPVGYAIDLLDANGRLKVCARKLPSSPAAVDDELMAGDDELMAGDEGGGAADINTVLALPALSGLLPYRSVQMLASFDIASAVVERAERLQITADISKQIRANFAALRALSDTFFNFPMDGPSDLSRLCKLAFTPGDAWMAQTATLALLGSEPTRFPATTAAVDDLKRDLRLIVNAYAAQLESIAAGLFEDRRVPRAGVDLPLCCGIASSEDASGMLRALAASYLSARADVNIAAETPDDVQCTQHPALAALADALPVVADNNHPPADAPMASATMRLRAALSRFCDAYGAAVVSELEPAYQHMAASPYALLRTPHASLDSVRLVVSACKRCAVPAIVDATFSELFTATTATTATTLPWPGAQSFTVVGCNDPRGIPTVSARDEVRLVAERADRLCSIAKEMAALVTTLEQQMARACSIMGLELAASPRVYFKRGRPNAWFRSVADANSAAQFF